MNQTLLLRICITALIVLLVVGGWELLKDSNDGVRFLFIVIVGVAGGIFVVKYVIPWLGDSIGESVYSSGEEVTTDAAVRAAACIAQGDYEGAIDEYNGMLRDKPDDPYPLSEIAKIYAEKLNNPDQAILFLQGHLEAKEWPVDDAAFIMFRLVEVYADVKGDYQMAHDLLEEVIANFPNTRHSANAHHRLHEVEQAEYQRIVAEKAKQAQASA
jgi:tetratricopeptide (TPR) repeat protein